LLDVGFAIYQSKGNTAFVGFSLPQLAEYKRTMGHIVTVNQKSVILAAKENVACLVGIVGEIHVDIGRVHDSAYRTMDFRVIAEEERL
jgi:hypothetical protein